MSKTNMYCNVKYKMLTLMRYLAKKSRRYSNLELIFFYALNLTYAWPTMKIDSSQFVQFVTVQEEVKLIVR